MGRERKRLEFIKTIQPTDECVLWPWCKATNGYGVMDVYIDGRYKKGGAHRFSCEIHHGPPPVQGNIVLHSCRNKECVNPRHLRWGTHSDNESDKVRDGTARKHEKHNLAKLTWEDVNEIRSSTDTQVSLAKRYGVGQPHISSIKLNKVWRKNDE